MTRARLEAASKVLFGALLALFTALVFEAGIRWTGLDMVALRPLLYFQRAALPLHELSPDPRLLYRLKPGSSYAFSPSYGPVDMSVNSLGLRGGPQAARKGKGVVRIVCVGASYVFGASVNDSETMPQQLEDTLNREFQGRFEVWNAGVSAYNTSQEAAYAEDLARSVEPDLIVFQLYNVGRRAFLLGQPYAQFFRAEPRLYLENLTYVPFSKSPWGLRLLASSALYRTGVIYLNYRHLREEPQTEQARRDNLESLRRFLTESRPGLDKVLLSLNGFSQESEAAATITLYQGPHVPAQLPPEYFLIHPPAAVYRLQAQIMAERLCELFPRTFRKKDPRASVVRPLARRMPLEELSPGQLSESERAMKEAGREDCLKPFLQALGRSPGP